MKVLGISGSGRMNGYSANIVKDLLKDINHETEFISLAQYNIRGCLGCLKCAENNICIQKDEFHLIIDKMKEADVVIFAGPNYYGSVNGISASFWERTFALRHREVFTLAGTLAVAIGLDRPESKPALKHIEKMMLSNKMAVIEKFSNPGHYQCYDCGFGHDCVVGNVFPRQGLCTPEFAEENRPMEYSTNVEAKKRIHSIAKLINSILDARI